MGLWVDRRECFVLFGHGCLGMEQIKETESERTMGRERD